MSDRNKLAGACSGAWAALLRQVLLAGVLALGACGDPPVEPLVSVRTDRQPQASSQPAAEPPTQAPVPARMVPAGTRGFRASAAAREAYRKALKDEPDLAAWSRQLAAQAASGNADAAATLADLHRDCAYWLREPADSGRHQGESPQDRTSRLVQVARCAGFGPAGELTAFNLDLRAQAWLETAAYLGDPSSRLNRRLSGGLLRAFEISPEELDQRAAVEELLRSGEYQQLLFSVNRIESLLHESKEVDMGMAWRHSICTVWPACPADDEGCLRRHHCNPLTMDAMLRRKPPRTRRMIAGQQALIERAIAAGDLAPLWRRLPPKPAGTL